MTIATPVERVIALLQTACFRRLETPISIAGVKFDFDAVLIGTQSMPDLVVVVDTTLEKDDRIKTKIEGVARALDVVRSKRPLTVILAGPRPRTTMLDAISKVCRVLPVGTLVGEDDDATLKNWLAVLMPLNLPQTSDAIADPMGELLQNVDASDAVTSELLTAAQRGADDVREVFHSLVLQPLDSAETEEP